MKAKTKVKKAKVSPIPKGIHALTTYLVIGGAGAAIEFYKKAFGAKERRRMPGPDGKSVAHAEIVIGDSVLMLADGFPGAMCKSPKDLGGSPASLVLYVKDCDAVFKRAVAAGAMVKQPMEDKFYGDRAGSLEDPFGYVWTVMTHVEDVSMKEMQKRMAEMCAKMAGQKGA